ncbi:MAG: CHAT domain-containing protein [Leptolyngbyaceae cyanobacterium]
MAFSISSVDSPEAQRFTDWCNQAEELSASARRTVEVLLAISGVEDCQIAEDILMNLTELDLSDRQISNLKPLASLTQLNTLYLAQNQITDIGPLSSLNQLTNLYLLDNQITNIRPLEQLENLNTLYLDNNQIEDLSPIIDLQSLEILYANSNRIQDISPIANLQNLKQLYLAINQIETVAALQPLQQLTHLDLGANQITNVDALAPLTRLTELGLNTNYITDPEALSSLKMLDQLDLRSNPLDQKTCPVYPATICLFSDDAADLYHLGEQQLNNGEFLAALQTFDTAFAVYQQGGDRLRQSDVLDRIGNAYDGLGQYANALDVYAQAATIRQTVGDRQGESETLTNLGITYTRLGQTNKAITSIQTAWDIYQQLTPPDRSYRRPEPREGIILSSLALAYSRSGDHPQALRFAKLSLASYRRGNNPAGEAIALTRIGEAYRNLGNHDKAQLYLDKALATTQALEDAPGMARSLHALGNLAVSLENPSLALEHYQQALDWRETLGDVAGQGETLNAMGQLLLDRGELAEAKTSLQAAIARWEALRPGLTDEDKIAIAETQAASYRLLQKVLIELNDVETSLEISERGRARAFAELLAHRLSLRGQPIPSEQFAPPPVSQIQQIAREQKATLVEYSLVQGEIYIWVVQPTGAIHFRRQPLGEKPLADWITDNRMALNIPTRGLGIQLDDADATARNDDYRNSLQELHQLLIAPVAEFLPTDSDASVIIIPQEELFLVPFPALIDANGSALLDKHPLLFAPAISLLNTPPSETPLSIGSDPALVVGNPVMPDDPATGSPLIDLQGAEEEARAIASMLNTQPLIGAEATKQTVLSHMQDAEVIHLATHGLLDDFGTGMPGALALTPTVSDSGFLTSAEIMSLQLQAQLVVLSACNTGQGTITGDGVVGLSRSLLTSGVDTVMVSLWSVPDQQTAFLMTEFYKELQQTPNRAIALRKAMLTVRQEYEHPYHWAAFTLFGKLGE